MALAALCAAPATAATAPALESALSDASVALASATAALRAGDDIPPVYRYPVAPPRDDFSEAEAFCHQATAASDGGLEFCTNTGETLSFTLIDSTSPRINPVGGGVRREFTFSAPNRARRAIGLLVYEWGTTDAGADDSAWSMMTEIVLLPRAVMPAVRRVGATYEVTLPTGEVSVFDAKTKEILSGPLVETGPIDRNPDRHARTFAALRYTGTGVMIRSDQRGDTPRSAVVWGQKKVATAVRGAKTCKLSPADIWKQTPKDGGTDDLYPTDAAFFAMLKAKCGWSIAP